MSDEKQSLASNSRKLYIRVGDESVEWSLALDAPAMLELLREAFDVPAEPMGDAYDDRCLVSRGSPLHLRVLKLLDKHGRG